MKETKSLKDISPKAWEHPADRAALQALRAIPGFEKLAATILGTINDTAVRLFVTASAIRVGPDQLPGYHEIFRSAAQSLDMELPPVFISNQTNFNAFAVGLDKPVLVFTSGLVQSLEPEELAFVAGHELGHVASGHSLYRTIIWLLQTLGNILLPQGIPQALGMGLFLALMEWYRKAELSCDRAGLLACQDADAARRGFLLMAGGTLGRRADLEAFRLQAREYRESGNALEEMLKVFVMLDQTHPFPALRLASLDSWIEEGRYRRILEGDYPRREDQPGSGDFGDWAKKNAQEMGSNMDDSRRAYQDEWNSNTGPLRDQAERLGAGLKQGLDQLGEGLQRLFGGTKPKP